MEVLETNGLNSSFEVGLVNMDTGRGLKCIRSSMWDVYIFLGKFLEIGGNTVCHSIAISFSSKLAGNCPYPGILISLCSTSQVD